VEEKIASTKAKIVDLEMELYGLYEMLNAASSPMLSLPLEILVEIFLIASDVDTHMNPAARRLPMQLIIGRVCSAWRNAAWNAPSLWRNLRIRVYKGMAHDQLIKEWLQRSKSQPLDLELHSALALADSPSYPLQVFQPLLEAASQWRRLDVCGGGYDELQRAISHTQHHFPLLSAISISNWETRSEDVWDFTLAPQLTEVHLNHLPTKRLRIDWSKLHTIRGGLTVVDWLFILKKAAPNLDSCTVNFEWGDPDPDRIMAVLLDLPSLPKLTNLSLELLLQNDDTIRDLGHILRIIRTPALRKLNLVFNGDGFGLLPLLPKMAIRSGCQLVELSIEYPDIGEAMLIQVLRMLPTLTQFTLASFPETRLFSDLTISMLDPALLPEGHSTKECLPRLEHLDYTGCIDFTPGKVITMLKNRWDHSLAGNNLRGIESITINYSNQSWAQDQDPNVMRDFYRELEAMVDLGTDVDISWN